MIDVRQEINTMLDNLPEPFLWTVFHFLKAILSLVPTITDNGTDKVSPSQHGRLALLKQAGSFGDDDTIDKLLDDVYTQRGRPEIDSKDVETINQEAEAHVYS